MSKKSTDYERLAEKIYKDLNPYATVVHDDHIYGYDSETQRQIDVSIRQKMGDTDILIIVQAKDHKRPVDVNVVGAFHTVVKDVRAQKGILICSAGFTKSAKTQAKKYSIELRSIHDGLSKNWSHDLSIPVLISHFFYRTKANLRVNLIRLENKEIIIPNRLVISLDNGKTKRFLDDYINEIVVNTQDFGIDHVQIIEEGTIKGWIEIINQWRDIRIELSSILIKKDENYMFFKPENFNGIKDHQTNIFKTTTIDLDVTTLLNKDLWHPLNNKGKEEIRLSPLKPILIKYFDHGPFTSAEMSYNESGFIVAPKGTIITIMDDEDK